MGDRAISATLRDDLDGEERRRTDEAFEMPTNDAKWMTSQRRTAQSERRRWAKDEPPISRVSRDRRAMDAANDKRFDFVADAVRVKPGNAVRPLQRSFIASPSRTCDRERERSFGKCMARLPQIKVR